MDGYRFLILLLLIIFSSLHLICAETHSHFFYTTVTNDSTYNYPSYYTTRSIDDITLFWYDSDNAVIERRVPWFKPLNGSLLEATVAEYKFQQMLQTRFEEYRNYMNDTDGLQMLQLMDGCVLYDDGTFEITFSLQYNGNPFMHFSMENGSWIADDPRAQVIADKNNRNKTVLDQNKNILKNACVPHITELLALGDCTFSRREQPVVVVTQTPITDSTSQLSCRAYGHYPKNISMVWYNKGESVPESLMEIVTLPLPEITYLTWLSVNINSMDMEEYVCIVDHISMMSPVMERLSGDYNFIGFSSNNNDNNVSGNFSGGIIGICVAVVAVVVFIVFTSIWWAKNRRR